LEWYSIAQWHNWWGGRYSPGCPFLQEILSDNLPAPPPPSAAPAPAAPAAPVAPAAEAGAGAAGVPDWTGIREEAIGRDAVVDHLLLVGRNVLCM
jgi:hypothetical protein